MSCGSQREEEPRDRCITYRLRQIIWGCPATPWNKKDGAFHSPLRPDKTVQRSRLMSIYLITVDRALNTSILDLSNTRRIVFSRVVCWPVWIWRLWSAGCLGKHQVEETAIIVLQDGVLDRTGEVYEVSTLQLLCVCFGTQNISIESLHALQILPS